VNLHIKDAGTKASVFIGSAILVWLLVSLHPG